MASEIDLEMEVDTDEVKPKGFAMMNINEVNEEGDDNFQAFLAFLSFRVECQLLTSTIGSQREEGLKRGNPSTSKRYHALFSAIRRHKLSWWDCKCIIGVIQQIYGWLG